MSKDQHVDSPPSYLESTGTSSGHDLLQQTIGARSQRIHQIVISLIIPILSSRASRGLSKSIIALIPLRESKILSKRKDEKAQIETIGLVESGESCEEVRLEEEIDTEEFWNQPETLRDLQRLLTTSIPSSSFYEPEEQLPVRPAPVQISRSFFGRKKAGSPSQPVIPKRQHIDVKVASEDMCYRVENDFGLYETIARPAIVIRVDTKA